jgi:hypothetical protein
MPSTAAPFGFEPVYLPSGPMYAQAFPDGIASAYGTAIYSGQPVILNTNGTLTAGTTNADILGIFAGVTYTPTGGRPILSPYWPASATYEAGSCTAYAYTDPMTVYRVQSDATLAATAVGDQADVSNVSNGSVYTGRSTCTLGTLKGNGVQGQFRVINLALEPGNAWGDTYVNVHVQIARHQYIAVKVAI